MDWKSQAAVLAVIVLTAMLMGWSDDQVIPNFLSGLAVWGCVVYLTKKLLDRKDEVRNMSSTLNGELGDLRREKQEIEKKHAKKLEDLYTSLDANTRARQMAEDERAALERAVVIAIRLLRQHVGHEVDESAAEDLMEHYSYSKDGQLLNRRGEIIDVPLGHLQRILLHVSQRVCNNNEQLFNARIELGTLLSQSLGQLDKSAELLFVARGESMLNGKLAQQRRAATDFIVDTVLREEERGRSLMENEVMPAMLVEPHFHKTLKGRKTDLERYEWGKQLLAKAFPADTMH